MNDSYGMPNDGYFASSVSNYNYNMPQQIPLRRPLMGATDFNPAYTARQHYNATMNANTAQLGFSKVDIRNVSNQLGEPDLVDPSRGGIAIWSTNTLRQRGFGYLKRVEIIDERVPCNKPVKHNGYMYIWVNVPLESYQVSKIIDMSPNIMYDQQKKLLIVRSDNLHTAIALAALVKLYSKGQVSMYQIHYHDLLKKYFVMARPKHGKSNKIMKFFKNILRK